MFSFKKALLLALAASAHASLLASESTIPEGSVSTETTRWTPPEGAINITGKTTLINELKRKHGIEATDDDVVSDAPSSSLGNGAEFVVMSWPLLWVMAIHPEPAIAYCAA